MKESIKQQLDGCQPDAFEDVSADADADLSELRAWLDESQGHSALVGPLTRCDESIRTALNDVEVPQGLAAKIKAGVLSSTSSDDSTLPAQTALLASAIDDDGSLTPAHREEFVEVFGDRDDHPVRLRNAVASDSGDGKTRRFVVAFGAVATLAAAVMLGMFVAGLFSQPSELITAQQLSFEAAQWNPHATAGEWNRDLSQVPQEYPFSDKLNVTPAQWKLFANRFDDKSVVYDMTPPGDLGIYLFVIRSGDRFEVPANFTETPIYPLDGFSIGACNRDGVVYVLLVEGDKNRYRKVVKTVGEFA